MSTNKDVLTYNAKLLLSKDDFRTLYNVLKQSADAYNECAQYLWNSNVPLNIRDVHQNVYDWMRNHYQSLRAQQVIRIYKDVLSAIRSIRSNKHEDPHCPRRANLSMRLDKRLYDRLTPNSISLSGFDKGKRKDVGLATYERLQAMFETYTTTDPLLFIRDGQAWLSISFNAAPKPILNDTALGVDLGMKRFITTSDGVVIDDKAYKARRRRVRFLKRTLCKKGTKSARLKLRKLRHKEHNMSKSHIYRSADTLLSSTSAGIIVLEDLSKLKTSTSKGKSGFKRKRHNNSISQVPFDKFKTILAYKAQLVGKRVETVSPKWTSQMDSRTGKRDGTRKGCRYYCKDGVVLDADWNAAVNIAKRSKHPLSNMTPVDGALRFLGGRPQSTGQLHVSPHYSGALQAAKSLD